MPTVITRQSPRESVVRTVQTWIETGRLVREEALPAETDLAARLQVSRGTARSALEELETRGILVKRNRKRYLAETSEPEARLHKTIALLGVDVPDPMRFKGTGFMAAGPGRLIQGFIDHCPLSMI